MIFLTLILLIESTALCFCTFDWVQFRWNQSSRTKATDVEAAVKEEKEEEDIETAVENFVDDHVEEEKTSTSNNPFHQTHWQIERRPKVSFFSCVPKQQQP